jgi:hypothetical protein
MAELWNRLAHSWWRHLALGLLFLGVAMWLTWPQAQLLGTTIVGGPIAVSDGWQKVWNLWWVRRALASGQNPLYTFMLFWPQGAPLGFQPIDITNALLTMPVLLAAGPVAAYGVAVILGFALSGWFSYALALRATGSSIGALAAGLVVEAAPSHMVRFLDGQLEHVSIQWVALYLLAMLHATSRPTFRSGLWVGLSAALVAYTNFYHLLGITLMTAIWLAAQLIARRRIWPLLRPWLAAAPLVLALLAPVVASYFSGVSEADRDAEHWRAQAQLYSADLVDLALPSANHPLWGEAVTAYQQRLHPSSAGWVVTPGYVALALAGVGLALCWREARLWGLIAGVLFLFVLGASLRINGYDTGVPLPVAWIIERTPGLSFGHRRFIIATVALAPLAVVVAFGVRALSERLRGRVRAAALAALLAAGLFEVAPAAIPVLYDDTSPIYSSLGGSGPLLELPVYPPAGLTYKSASLRAQMVHGRAISAGYVARPPDYPLGRGAPLIGQLGRPRCEPAGIVPDTPAIARSALSYYGFTQIVVHDEQLSGRERECARQLLEDTLGLKPSHVAGPVRAYDLAPAPLRPFIFLGDGWLPLEHNGDRVWRWMTGQGKLYLVNTDNRPRTFAVHLRALSYDHPRDVTFSLDRRAQATLTVDSALPARTYSLVVTLDSGQHVLQLAAPTDRDAGADRDISILVESATITQLPLTP